jgi:hypothetical protein
VKVYLLPPQLSAYSLIVEARDIVSVLYQTTVARDVEGEEGAVIAVTIHGKTSTEKSTAVLYTSLDPPLSKNR